MSKTLLRHTLIKKYFWHFVDYPIFIHFTMVKFNVFNPSCISVLSFENRLTIIITLLCMSTAMIRISIDTCIGLVSVRCLYVGFVILDGIYFDKILVSKYKLFKVRQWHTTCRWFSPGTPDSSTNKTDRHDITEIAGLTQVLRNGRQFVLH
jgi:hypothetical protein